MTKDSLKAMFSSERHDWATPWDIVQAQVDYPFDLDVCALENNAKAEKFYTPEMNGLTQPWVGKCFLNPPFGREIPKWIERAYIESQKEYCYSVTALLPARVDTSWFHEWIWNCSWSQTIFLRGRIKFVGADNSAPFPSMITRWKRK